MSSFYCLIFGHEWRPLRNRPLAARPKDVACMCACCHEIKWPPRTKTRVGYYD